MKKYILIISSLLVFFSCQNSKKEQDTNFSKKEDNFEMYKMSEMAILMEQMYVDNERLKSKIQKGETIGNFPEHYAAIKKAKMTDETDMDDFFKQHAQLFLDSQQKIYENPDNAKQLYNEGIDACIKCHEEKCGGPIPKIKKLYLK